MTTAEQTCPDCGGNLRFVDQTSFSGRKLREYRCEKCGKSVVEDLGIALWQILHDANESDNKGPG